MTTVEKPKESISALPDFASWAKTLAEKMGEPMTPEREESINLTLEWMYDAAAAAKKFSAEQKQKVVDFVDSLKSSQGQMADLHLLMETEVADPNLKKALAELIAHAEGSKNTLQDATEQAPVTGGVPVDAPSAPATQAETPETDANAPESPESGEPPAAQAEGDGAAPTAESGENTDKDSQAAKTVETLQDYQQTAKNMGLGELMSELFKMLKDLFSKISGDTSLTSGGEKFTEEEIKQVKVDFSRVDETKTLTSSNKDVEYVAKVLNLPAKPDANAFLASLKNVPNCVFSAEKEISKLKTGDVLFFHDGKDKEKAKTTAIVSNPGPPPMMKLVNDQGKIHEVTVAQSSLFNNWLGFVTVPEGTGPTVPAAQTQAAPAGAEAQPPVGPQPAPATPAQQPQAAPAGAEALPPVGPQPTPAGPESQPPIGPQPAPQQAPDATANQPQANEKYSPGTEKPVFSDVSVLRQRITDLNAKNSPKYTTDSMPSLLGKTKPEIEPYLTNVDPVTGGELTFLGRPFKKPPNGGINLMMIPFLKAAEEKIKQSKVNYKPQISRYHGYDFRGLKIGGVESPDIKSSHAFGMAFDIDPSTNWPKDGRGDIPDQVVMALVESGFAWGSVPEPGFHFGEKGDPMHFQLKVDPRDSQGRAIINSSPAASRYWEKISPMLNEVDTRVKGSRQARIA